MITGLILRMLADVASALLNALPHIGVPSWLSDNGAIGQVFQAAGSMGVWFPVALASTVLLAVVGIWLAGFGVKVARMVISVFTGGGGGAG